MFSRLLYEFTTKALFSLYLMSAVKKKNCIIFYQNEQFKWKWRFKKYKIGFCVITTRSLIGNKNMVRIYTGIEQAYFGCNITITLIERRSFPPRGKTRCIIYRHTVYVEDIRSSKALDRFKDTKQDARGTFTFEIKCLWLFKLKFTRLAGR